jgi:hypothetical protein
VRFLDHNGNPRECFNSGDPVKIEFSVAPLVPLNDPQFGIGVDDGTHVRIFSLATYLSSCHLTPITQPCTVTCCIDSLPLAPGRYLLSLSAGTSQNNLLDALDHAVALTVEPGDFYSNGRAPSAGLGKVLMRSAWNTREQC